MKNNNQNGFSLVELSVTLLLVTIVGLALPKLLEQAKQIEIASTKSSQQERAWSQAIYLLSHPERVKDLIYKLVDPTDINDLKLCFQKSSTTSCLKFNSPQYKILSPHVSTDLQSPSCPENQDCPIMLSTYYKINCPQDHFCSHVYFFIRGSETQISPSPGQSKLKVVREKSFTYDRLTFINQSKFAYDMSCSQNNDSPFLLSYDFDKNKPNCSACQSSDQHHSCSAPVTEFSLGSGGYSTELKFDHPSIDISKPLPEHMGVTVKTKYPTNKDPGKLSFTCQAGGQSLDLTSQYDHATLTEFFKKFDISELEIPPKGSGAYRLECQITVTSTLYEGRLLSYSHQWVTFFTPPPSRDGGGGGGGSGDGGGGTRPPNLPPGSGGGGGGFNNPSYDWP